MSADPQKIDIVIEMIRQQSNMIQAESNAREHFENRVERRFGDVDKQFKEIRADMDAQFKDVDARFRLAKSDMDTQFKEIRLDMDAQFKEVRLDIDAQFEDVQGSIKQLNDQKVTWNSQLVSWVLLGSIVLSNITALVLFRLGILFVR